MTTHTITLARHTAQVVGLMGVLVLGTWDSYGTEQLLLRHGPEWEGLAIDATFHNTPNDEGVTVLADTDGLVTVPPEACMRASKYATITFRGVQDGVQRISCNLPYVVLDHAQVPGANSTATPSENAQALAQMQDLRDGAVDAKSQAEVARDGAANSAAAAKESETNAGQSATAAAKSAVAAKESETSTGQSATAAAKSAVAANESETNAGQSATAAAKSAVAAKESETSTGQSATAAAKSAVAANESETSAGQSATAAAKSAVAANESETSAGQSATAAAKSATAAAGSEKAAAGVAKTASDAAAEATDAKAAAVAAQKDAAASKAAAANSSAAAKTSEDAAAKSAADADSTANSINNSMMQIAANKEAVSRLKEDTAALQKRQNVLVGSETGNLIAVDDAFAAPLCVLTVYGRSTQDGTPTPDAPVPIVSAGDGGTIVLTLGDGDGKTQTLTLPTPTGLPGIPVTSGGNYTDENGQQWICDEVDLERGMMVQRVYKIDVDGENIKFEQTDNYANLSLRKLPIALYATGQRTYAISTFTSLSWFYNMANGQFLYLIAADISGQLNESCKKQLGKVYYALATPIETPLTPAEIAAYKALTAYAPDTVVQASDGAGVKLEYQRDVNIAIKKLEDAIASITAT